MKSFLITFLTLTAFFTSLCGQWDVINEGYDFNLIDFVRKDVGWMSTEDAVLKTMDGGETWISNPWNLVEEFVGIDFTPNWSDAFGSGISFKTLIINRKFD